MNKTWKPTTGGILTIIAGALKLISGIVFATAAGILGAILGMGWFSAIGVPLIVFGIIAIIGGVHALRRRTWGLALAGSICALVPFVIPGILAIIFVSQSKSEFESTAMASEELTGGT